MTPVIEKKVAVRKRHEKAIKLYRIWLKTNSKASRERKIQTFDLFIDSAYLDSVISDG
jgi:hypothetical protein